MPRYWLARILLSRSKSVTPVSCQASRSPREKRSFVLRPRTTSPSRSGLQLYQERNYRNEDRPQFQPAASRPARQQVRIRIRRNNSGGYTWRVVALESAASTAASVCAYAPPPRCQKTRWHLKERSQGQEASLRLSSLGPTGDSSSPHPLLFHPPLPPAGCSLLHRLRLPFSLPPTPHLSPHTDDENDDEPAIIPPRRVLFPPALRSPPCGPRASCRPVRE